MISSLYQKIKSMKERRPKDYAIYKEMGGKCSVCGSTEETDVYHIKSRKSGVDFTYVFCVGCMRIHKECERLGIEPESYKEQKEGIIREIFGRLDGVFARRHKFSTEERDRQVYDLFLRGRDHAHTASIYGISRERVRQIVYKIQKANPQDGRKKVKI